MNGYEYGGTNHLRGMLQHLVRIAVDAHHILCGLAEQPIRLRIEGGRGVAAVGSLIPLHPERIAGLLRAPPRIGDDGDTAAQPVVDAGAGLARRCLELPLCPREHEDIAHAAQRLDLIHIGTLHRGVEDGALLEHRVAHSRNFDVDSKLLTTHDDPCLVGIDNRVADDFERRRVFQCHRLESGDLEFRGVLRQLAVSQRPAGGRVTHDALRNRALGRGHAPLRGGSADQHLSTRCPRPAQRQPIRGCGVTAAGGLTSQLAPFIIRHFDDDVLPGDVEFFREDHRQCRLRTLAHFRIRRDDRDHPRRADARVQRDRILRVTGAGRGTGCGRPRPAPAEGYGSREQQAAADGTAGHQETTPSDAGAIHEAVGRIRGHGCPLKPSATRRDA